MLALGIAAITGSWRMKQLYHWGYGLICGAVVLAGVAGVLPRAGFSTKSEGTERRYFYTAVWSVTAAQTLLLVLWKALPLNRKTAMLKLAVFAGTLAFMGLAGLRGLLPRTKPNVSRVRSYFLCCLRIFCSVFFSCRSCFLRCFWIDF
jgi:zinc transporter ZupT